MINYGSTTSLQLYMHIESSCELWAFVGVLTKNNSVFQIHCLLTLEISCSVWWARLLSTFCFSHMTVCSKHSMPFCKQLFPFFRRRKIWAETVHCSASFPFKNLSFPSLKTDWNQNWLNSVFCRELSHCRIGALISGKMFCKVYLGWSQSLALWVWTSSSYQGFLPLIIIATASGVAIRSNPLQNQDVFQSRLNSWLDRKEIQYQQKK